MSYEKITSRTIQATKANPQATKIIAITAYDYSFARIFDEWADIILIGDSLGMVIQGNSNTLSVKVDEIIYHTKAVAKGVHKAHVVADMPFMSYQVSVDDAIRNAGRLLSEGQAEAVKLEGGVTIAPTVERLVDLGIPVMGHIGLTPQSVHRLGGYKIQGKTDASKESILQDALALEDAGVYSIVLEGIPTELAKSITERLKVPTIGIAAGPFCNGQILVSYDLLGLTADFSPKFVKNYGNLREAVGSAIKQYREEVIAGLYPDETHSF